jgi:hypothetical protein
MNGWQLHDHGWSENKAARSGAKQDNLFPAGRKGCLEKKLLKNMDSQSNECKHVTPYSFISCFSQSVLLKGPALLVTNVMDIM